MASFSGEDDSSESDHRSSSGVLSLEFVSLEAFSESLRLLAGVPSKKCVGNEYIRHEPTDNQPISR